MQYTFYVFHQGSSYNPAAERLNFCSFRIAASCFSDNTHEAATQEIKFHDVIV